MGEALDIAAVAEAWVAMLQAPQRPSPGTWWSEREPSLRQLSDGARRLEISADVRLGLLRDEAALLVDGVLAPVARGRGALDLAIGEGLGALAQGDRVLRLGFVSIGDYAREKLGIGARAAQGMAQLSRELSQRPLLREAVLRGEVGARKALAVLRVALDGDEAQWVERTRSETVRGLEAAVRAERGENEAEEEWEKVWLPLSAGQRPQVDEALLLAGKVAGGGAPRHQRLEAMAQEYLGENPDDGEEEHQGCEGEGRCWEPPGHAGAQSGGEGSGAPAGATAAAGEASASDGEAAGGEPQRCETAAAGSGPWHGKATGVAASGGPAGATAEPAWSFVPPPERGFMSWPVEDWLEATKEGLEVETSRWEALGVLDPVAAPRAGEEASPQALDEELRRLLGMRRRWDELLGHLGLVMKHLGLSRELGFASFDHYCVERLWMAPRTVEQRVWLERRFYHLPGLREAMRAGRLSYEQARLVAAVAEADEVEDWIRRAEGMTCIALKRFIDKEEERQMCAREELTLLVPVRVAELLAAAFRAARNKAGRWLTPEECLVEIARHFTKVWKGVVVERSTPQRRARQRDELCQVPGCSRIAAQAHHIIPVSQGGTDDPWNLVGVCAAHHLVCIHRGWVRVSGRAPDQLVWQLGERTGVRPEPDDARGEEVFA